MKPQGVMRLDELGKLETNPLTPNDSRTRDFPACDTVPQSLLAQKSLRMSSSTRTALIDLYCCLSQANNQQGQKISKVTIVSGNLKSMILCGDRLSR
jgi:hypothetical protein